MVGWVVCWTLGEYSASSPVWDDCVLEQDTALKVPFSIQVYKSPREVGGGDAPIKKLQGMTSTPVPFVRGCPN